MSSTWQRAGGKTPCDATLPLALAGPSLTRTVTLTLTHHPTLTLGRRRRRQPGWQDLAATSCQGKG